MKRTKAQKAGPSKKAAKNEKASSEPKSDQESSDEEASTSKALLVSKPDYQNFEQFLTHLNTSESARQPTYRSSLFERNECAFCPKPKM